LKFTDNVVRVTRVLNTKTQRGLDTGCLRVYSRFGLSHGVKGFLKFRRAGGIFELSQGTAISIGSLYNRTDATEVVVLEIHGCTVCSIIVGLIFTTGLNGAFSRSNVADCIIW